MTLILVAVDGFERSPDAVAFTRALAGASGANGAVGRVLPGSTGKRLLRAPHARSSASSWDLLVTGSRRRRPLGAVLLGAVTGRLLRRAACPVMVAPRGVEACLAELPAIPAEAAR